MDIVDSLLANKRYPPAPYGHIQEVIIQNFRAKEGTAMANAPEPDKEDMLRTLAVARLILSPEISLQAPPNLAADYVDYVGAGINDWGGISPLTQDFINPERAWPHIESLAAKCAQAGYRLKERLTVYRAFQAIHSNDDATLPEMRIRALASTNGLALNQCHSQCHSV
ncbi:hypothetical protein P4S72_08060 [Vibrio sp. PP-XX7]